MDISDWRKRIDEVDAKLVSLLADRSGCVVEIGRLKRERNLAVRDPQREERIMGQIVRSNKGPLANEAMARIFETIINECVLLEEQGDRGHEQASSNSPRSL